MSIIVRDTRLTPEEYLEGEALTLKSVGLTLPMEQLYEGVKLKA